MQQCQVDILRPSNSTPKFFLVELPAEKAMVVDLMWVLVNGYLRHTELQVLFAMFFVFLKDRVILSQPSLCRLTQENEIQEALCGVFAVHAYWTNEQAQESEMKYFDEFTWPSGIWKVTFRLKKSDGGSCERLGF